MKVVHFVNRADFNNAGDFACGIPGMLLLRDCVMLNHDIDSVSWNHIQRGDVVVVGASGMLNVTESFNRNIIRLLDVCDTVIGWGIGFNRTPGQEPQTDIFPHLSRFKLLGIRDYNNPHGIRYIPCPSVFLLGMAHQQKEMSMRKFGVLNHRDYPVHGSKGYPSIANSRSLQEVLDFIVSCETIVTSSYHGVYWSQLLGRKVLLGRTFSDKFNWFRYPPPQGDLQDVEKATSVPEGFFEECLDLNNIFMKEVCSLINASRDRPGGTIMAHAAVESRLANLSWRVATLEMNAGRHQS